MLIDKTLGQLLEAATADPENHDALGPLADYCAERSHLASALVAHAAPRLSKEPPPPELLAAEFLVEATGFECLCLWQRHAEDSTERPQGEDWNRFTWKQHSAGSFATVGWVLGWPVCVSFTWADINGHRVGFYETTSAMSHHMIVRAWLKKHHRKRYDGGTRWAFTDAMNFHSCLDYVLGRLP